jgi:hypothetical protein
MKKEKQGPPSPYEGMYVQQFELPPSQVNETHPNAKAGEFYASCQDRKSRDLKWAVGPFATYEEARLALLNEALRLKDDGWLASVKILDERNYQMNHSAQAILTAISRISNDDAKLCFEWALLEKAKRDEPAPIRQDQASGR